MIVDWESYLEAREGWLARGMMPTAEIAPLFRKALIEWYGEAFEANGAAGNLPRILRRWENEQEYVEFDGADRIFAHFWRTPEVWTEDVPHLYYAITFKETSRAAPRRCERKGCSELIVNSPRTANRQGKNKKRFCSQVCLTAAWMAKKNGSTYVAGPKNKLRKMVCRKGHDMHGDNVRTRTDANGHTRSWCHACKIIQQRKYRDAKARRLAGTNG